MLDNLGKTELMNFVSRMMMLEQQEMIMRLGEMEGTELMEEEGITVDSFGSSFWTLGNIALTST